jgi:hypothetical protein
MESSSSSPIGAPPLICLRLSGLRACTPLSAAGRSRSQDAALSCATVAGRRSPNLISRKSLGRRSCTRLFRWRFLLNAHVLA